MGSSILIQLVLCSIAVFSRIYLRVNAKERVAENRQSWFFLSHQLLHHCRSPKGPMLIWLGPERDRLQPEAWEGQGRKEAIGQTSESRTEAVSVSLWVLVAFENTESVINSEKQLHLVFSLGNHLIIGIRKVSEMTVLIFEFEQRYCLLFLNCRVLRRHFVSLELITQPMLQFNPGKTRVTVPGLYTEQMMGQ